jgi:FkbM family methyltransferase
MIRAARSTRLYEFAASDKSGVVTLFVAEGAERAHGVSTISADEKSLDKIKSYGFTYREVQVQTKKLDEILSELKPDCEIDFVSIDVEGHELDVLRGFSIERWLPTVIILEDNSNFENVDVSNYMKQFGYVRFKRTGVNDWYAHKKNKKLVNLYSRGRYNWTVLKVRAKKQIKKIPGVVKVRNFLLKCFAKSA